MKSLLAVSILALISRVASKCPSGTMQGLNDQDCYHFEAVPAMWLKAEEDCIRRKGHLASVSSAMTNAMLRKISSIACAREFWLGGSWNTESPQQWSWTDDRRFSYKNWAAGQPIDQENYCIALDASGGRWYSRACSTAKPYICKLPPLVGAVATTTTASSCPACPTTACRSSSVTSTGAYTTSTIPSTTTTPISGRCRDGWTYVAAAGGKCLRLTDSPGTWSQSWAECRRLGGDLVSIPNNSTNYAVRDYAYSQADSGAYSQSWFGIGLHRTTTSDPWQWTDGTPVTYTNWDSYYDIVPKANVTFIGVYGQNTSRYNDENARWENNTEDTAWTCICESHPL